MIDGQIFRREALEYREGSKTDGELVMLLPGWTRWTYRLLLAMVAVSTLFLLFGTVAQYADGPAVIRAGDRVAVTAAVAGIVVGIPKSSGDQVRSGDTIVTLRSTEEGAQLASLEREFDSALVRMLANPLDTGARQSVATLRTQKDLLAERLKERLVRAPVDGAVGDVRVRIGQLVSPGDVLASVAQEPQRFSVIVLMPGGRRPELSMGQSLRLEISGYSYVYHDLTIERIDDEIVGPQEVRRALGREVADAIVVNGPVVIVHATLPRTSFEAGGRRYAYYDGMHGIARARVRSERIVTTLLPGIRLFTEKAQ